MRNLTVFAAAVLLLWFASPAHATVANVFPGDLIKLADDGDKTTHADEAVYYFDQDWFRHPFPNAKVYFSWYRDFSGVKELTAGEMAEIRLAGPITYRPGTRLIKIPSVPKVFALEPGGVMRWIESESVALALYGSSWSQRVDDVSETLFTSYKEGAPLTAPVWPTGTLVRRDADDSLFIVEGYGKRHLMPAAADSIRVQEKFVIRTNSNLNDYADRGEIISGDVKYTDVSQIGRIDVASPPLIDFPVTIRTAERGKEQALAAFRLSTGEPVIVRQIRVRLSGPLFNYGDSMLKDLKFVDVFGLNLFGTKQLESGSNTETLTFSGAYTMMPNTVSIIELKAITMPNLPVGAKIDVVIDRDNMMIGDSSSSTSRVDFYPKTSWAATTVEIK